MSLTELRQTSLVNKGLLISVYDISIAFMASMILMSTCYFVTGLVMTFLADSVKIYSVIPKCL
jgi:hypothetical protein